MAQGGDGIRRKRPEPHFQSSQLVHDIVIGMSDGLTVPFAIAAGMSGASVASRVVIIAGLSEIAAGSISMGLGGYLSNRTDMEHYEIERQREMRETHEVPEQETREVIDIFENHGLDEEEAKSVTEKVKKDRDKWVDFMMRFELGLEKPDPQQAVKSGATIGLSYAAAGFIPLTPYIVVHTVQTALFVSAAVTMAALITFGYLKGRLTGVSPWSSALQTAVVGGIAAGAAFGLARLIA